MDKNIFFEQNKLKTVMFTPPAGGEIELRELTAGQRSKLQKIIADDPVKAQAHIIAMSCPLFDENDVDKLLTMAGSLVEKMADVVIEISGVGGTAVDDTKKK